jgi:hypothetical protein
MKPVSEMSLGLIVLIKAPAENPMKVEPMMLLFWFEKSDVAFSQCFRLLPET